jgi:hypothetical protein
MKSTNVEAKRPDEASPAERPFYTDRELAARYRVCRSTVWNWAKAGIVEKMNIGGAARFRDPIIPPQRNSSAQG